MDLQQLTAERAAILDQINTLQQKADALHESIKSAARQQILALMREAGLDAEQVLAPFPASKPKPAKVASEVMYRDPDSGKTWSGKGRAPAWVGDHGQRTKYLVQPSAN